MAKLIIDHSDEIKNTTIHDIEKDYTDKYSAGDVMDRFMKKLDNGELVRDKEPSTGEELQLDDKFIEEQVEDYIKLLDSSLMEKVQDKELVKTNAKSVNKSM